MFISAAAYFDHTPGAEIRAAPSRGLHTKFSRTLTFWLMHLNQTHSMDFDFVTSLPFDDTIPEGRLSC